MRIAKRILTVIFIIAFIASVSLNIILFPSSTSKLILKDSTDERLKLYYNAYINLNETLEFSTVVYDHNNNTKDNTSCYYDKEKVGDNKLVCTQISYKYDSNNNLIKTSYFPGNGHRYSVNGETLEKTVYSNEDLSSYAYSIVVRTMYMLGYLNFNPQVDCPETEKMSYKIDYSFDFKTLSLDKEIEFTHEKGEEKSSARFTFDEKDRVTKAFVSDYQNTVIISYEKTDLEMPDLTLFN